MSLAPLRTTLAPPAKRPANGIAVANDKPAPTKSPLRAEIPALSKSAILPTAGISPTISNTSYKPSKMVSPAFLKKALVFCHQFCFPRLLLRLA